MPYRARDTGRFRMSQEAARQIFVRTCYDWLDLSLHSEYEFMILHALRENWIAGGEVEALWLKRAASLKPEDLGRWFYIGRVTNALRAIPKETVKALMPNSGRQFALELFRVGRTDVLELDPSLMSAALESILAGELRSTHMDSPLSFLANSLDWRVLGFAARNPRPMSMLAMLRHYQYSEGATHNWIANTAVAHEFKSYARTVESELARPTKDWASSLEPWSAVIKAATEQWGESRSLQSLALVAVGAQRPRARKGISGSLFDEARPLLDRTMESAAARNDVRYWSNQFEWAKADSEQIFVLMSAVAWCGMPILVLHANSIGQFLETKDRKTWAWFYRECFGLRFAATGRFTEPHDVSQALPEKCGDRCIALFAKLSAPDAARNIAHRFSVSLNSNDNISQTLRLMAYLDGKNLGKKGWKPNLQEVSTAFVAGGRVDDSSFLRRSRVRSCGLNLEDAREILSAPSRFPPELVSLAEVVQSNRIRKKTARLATVARRNGWDSLV
jgi:hypothetical protein